MTPERPGQRRSTPDVPTEKIEQDEFALARRLASIEARHPAECPADNLDLRSYRNLAIRGGVRPVGQADEAAPVNHGLQVVDFMIGAFRRAVADPDQAQDAEGRVDRPPAVDDAAEKIAVNNGAEARVV